MYDLICKLTALQIYCKDAHYSFKGIDFKPLHEWVDEIADPIYDWLDELKEHYYLFNDTETPRGTKINDDAKQYIPEALGTNAEILSNLQAVLYEVHKQTELVEENKLLGISDIIGKIDNHIMKHIALINLALRKKD